MAETGALAASLRRGRRGEGSKAERHESFRIGLKRLLQDHYMWLMTIETSFYLAFCTSSFWHQQLRRIEICRLQLFFS